LIEKTRLKSLVLLAGATEAEVPKLVESLIAEKTFNLEKAQQFLKVLRS